MVTHILALTEQQQQQQAQSCNIKDKVMHANKHTTLLLIETPQSSQNLHQRDASKKELWCK
jgi:hypothetical protein